MTQIDVEVTVPDHEALLNDRAKESLAAAIRMIEAGAKPGPVLTMIFLLGYFDGLVQV